jgi:hypothetical protein
MINERNSKTDPGEPMVYQIRIKGHLGSQWTDWFGGLTLTLEDNGETLLTGPVIDQAALHGLLKKVRDVGIPLLSVNRVEPGRSTALGTGPADASNVKQEMNDRIKANLEETHESTNWS